MGGAVAEPWPGTLCCVVGQDTEPGVQTGTGELFGKLTNFLEVTCDRLASRPGRVETLIAAPCSSSYMSRDH